MKRLWSWLVDWFEYGDLVPLLVVVSAVHYAAVLADKDLWPVAIAIGVLVDIGHFRTVLAAFRYNVPGQRRKRGGWLHRLASRVNGQLAARWMIALTMTAISLAYHQRYYDDWWLSAPIPFLIAALAWLQQVDKRTGKNATHSDAFRRIPSRIPTHPKSAPSHTCKICGASFAKSTELATHTRWTHREQAPEPERVNGRVK